MNKCDLDEAQKMGPVEPQSDYYTKVDKPWWKIW
jgi:hypothetical protein